MAAARGRRHSRRRGPPGRTPGRAETRGQPSRLSPAGQSPGEAERGPHKPSRPVAPLEGSLAVPKRAPAQPPIPPTPPPRQVNAQAPRLSPLFPSDNHLFQLQTPFLPSMRGPEQIPGTTGGVKKADTIITSEAPATYTGYDLVTLRPVCR